MKVLKIPIFCFLFITLALFFNCGQISLLFIDKDVQYLHDYRNIPGVTKEDIAAIEEMKKQKLTFTYGTMLCGEAFRFLDGSRGGFSVMFCDMLSEMFKMHFEHKFYDWDALIQALDNKELDFSGELTATKERRERYFMTDAIYERTIKIFTNRFVDIHEIAEIRPLRYAFLEDTITSEQVKNVTSQPFKTVYVSDYETAAEKLRRKEIDAFFEEAPAIYYFEEYDFITIDDYFPLIFSPVSMTTSNPDYAAIIRVVQKFLENDGIYHLAKMYSKGNKDYMRHKLEVLLSIEERAYIKDLLARGESVKVAALSDNYPLSFFNDSEDEMQGVAIDILNGISKLTGLRFEIEHTPNLPAEELLEHLRSGQVSMITNISNHEDNKKDFLIAVNPYAFDKFALLTSAEHPDIELNQILYSTIGLVKDSEPAQIFKIWFPNANNVRYYNTFDEAFEAIERFDIDFVMASSNILLSQTNYREQPNFKASIVLDHQMLASFGFNKNNEMLKSIIHKAQLLVETNVINDSWTRRVFNYRDMMLRSLIPFIILIFILFIILFTALLLSYIKNKKMGKNLEHLVEVRTHELEVQTGMAKEASSAKSFFLARMSHEIRTPLNAIIGMAHIAGNSVKNPDKVLHSINEITTSSSHLLAILNDVLDMSKIESGKFEIAKESFNLIAAFSEVSSIIQQRCKEKYITFETNYKSVPDMFLIGDKLRLNQVLINLLGNSVKFTEIKGHVEFYADVLEETESNIKIAFQVKDNGIGMSKEVQEKIFSAFEQADRNTSSRFGGTGLGLSISQNLVRLMGGEITVESELGKGAVFRFNLSFIKADAGTEIQTEKTIDNVDLTGKRILLVEDIEVNRIILKELLSSTNVEIDDAEDGLQAVNMFMKSEPGYYDLIFMDVQMPLMDGYEATAQIRNAERSDSASIPIVAMTANAYQEDINKALAAGMNGHLSKPIEINTVLHTLANILLKD